ncbi:MAG: oligosaccharide flippase family protein [Flavobacteriaceae bacterium]|nr:oligosaccharide flippase family protein [Muriicola sp.]NNC62584.1 oligosaccharide flippase family protein [Eudoraea sp.]NNK20941.1 oligosaccharide flippase family protein [Flavobacteriaceae bacterium]NNL39480.1 oligosaccharide flippase family protein [Flavobacteriaceae bacterium]
MSLFQKLFKQTFIYGLATVLPRMLSFILVPLYTQVMPTGSYGEVTLIFAWFAIFNVVLAYGMETAFFRFYNSEKNKTGVISTSLVSLMGTTALFTVFALIFQDRLALLLNIDGQFIKYVIFILALDALAIIPFALLRAKQNPQRYAVIKILNVAINLSLNVFFLLILPGLAKGNTEGLTGMLYIPDFEISYIFISNLIASGFTLLLISPSYKLPSYKFDRVLWSKMIRYGLPVMIAGIAFTINEVFDRIMLSELLPSAIAKSEIGKYSACYKIALFMTLFATAFRLGIEPFFFSHSRSENPQRAYAQITNYFVVLGSVILLAVVVYSDLLKVLIVRNSDYWEAMPVVPIIVLASFCLGIYHNLSVWYKVTDRTRFGAYISIAGAIITIAINYLFIPSIGYYASAYATLAAYASMMFISYYFGRKYYPIPYNFRKIGFYMGISILFSALSFYVFNGNILIGSLLLLVFLLLVYKMEYDLLKRIFIRNES